MAQYRMPPVYLGDVVWWRPGEGAPASAALVTEVSEAGVELAVVHVGYRNFQIYSHVHHANHPDKDYPAVTESGIWEHRRVGEGREPQAREPIKARKGVAREVPRASDA